MNRRTLLVGGGLGAGLLIAWGLWPRSYAPNLRAGPDETLFNAFLKIAGDGRVMVAVPQVEMGQGTYTSLPQILADELGADWRTVSVEAAPISPLYANQLVATQTAEETLPSLLHGAGRWTAHEYATRSAMMYTGGSTSVRAFEPRLREAGAAARALLSMAAAERWGVDWEALDTAGGFVVNGAQKIAFAELANDAAQFEIPSFLPARGGTRNRLAGEPLPRLDLPSKVDGSAQFAADVRLPDMIYASVRSAPPGAWLSKVDRKAAYAVPGVLGVFENPGWAGAAASNWWAANRGLEAMKPRFAGQDDRGDTAGIKAALAGALERDEGARIVARGDVGEVFGAGEVLRARYSVAPAANGALETLTATARLRGDQLEIWAPVQAQGLARAAAARAAGLDPARVTLYPMLVGGGYGRKLETQAIEQVATMAMRTRRPVQLVWSRAEEMAQDSFRPPARAELSARLGEGGIVLGWQARIAAPPLTASTDRLGPASRVLFAESGAVAGAEPPYGIGAVAVDHLPAPVAIKTGIWRSGAHSYTAFFTECFIDELARKAGVEPLSFRMQMLGDNPRLAQVLSTAAALGGWDGGQSGSNMGIAAHSAFGSHVATLVEVEVDPTQRVRVSRAVAAVDCGRVVNPNIVRQQIEGGILFGIAAATSVPVGFRDGRPDILNLGRLGLPTLAQSPEVTVEILPSEENPGGVTELGVPPVAPAIANAIFSSTGQRLRSLPLVMGSGA